MKATVDAYTGAVTLYAWDAQDPLLRAWKKVFPGTVKPLVDDGGRLMSHVRYPEDLFKVQRTLLAQYHVTDANAFFGGQDFWQVPDDPTDHDGVGAGGAAAVLPDALQMPGQTKPTFSLTGGVHPQERDAPYATCSPAILAVDSDAGSTGGQRRDGYGTLRLLQLPKNIVVPAPGSGAEHVQAQPRGQQPAERPAGCRGSKLQYGNLLTLPLAGGLLYVQPVYVSASTPGRSRSCSACWWPSATRWASPSTLQCALDQVVRSRPTGTSPAVHRASQTGGRAATGRGDADTDPVAVGVGQRRRRRRRRGGRATPRRSCQQALADANQALAGRPGGAGRRVTSPPTARAQARLKADIARALAAQKQLGVTSSARASPRAARRRRRAVTVG